MKSSFLGDKEIVVDKVVLVRDMCGGRKFLSCNGEGRDLVDDGDSEGDS